MNKLIAISLIFLMAILFVAPVFAIPGDVNGDGKVDLTDLVLLAKAYNSHPGDSNWDARCDFNGNNWIELSDLVTIGIYYGK